MLMAIGAGAAKSITQCLASAKEPQHKEITKVGLG